MAERLPRPDRVEGRPLSPRAFRPFGIEAVVLGSPTTQEGLVRREGVAVLRRMAEHGPVFDRLAATAAVDPEGLLPVRVVVAATPARDRAMRVPAIGDRATRVEAATEPPPSAGWLLLVDEGPGETWLYLPEEDHPAAVDAFLGRRGRTDFARARRRSGIGSLASLGLLLGLFLVIYGSALNLGPLGQLAGAAMIVASRTALDHGKAPLRNRLLSMSSAGGRALGGVWGRTPPQMNRGLRQEAQRHSIPLGGAPGPLRPWGMGGRGPGLDSGRSTRPGGVPGRPVRVATLTT